MKEDELIGKLVKDYRLNEDEELVAIILEDGTEIQPSFSMIGNACLSIMD